MSTLGFTVSCPFGFWPNVPKLSYDCPSIPWVEGERFYKDDGPCQISTRRPGEWKLDDPLPKSFILKPGEQKSIPITFNLPAGEYNFLFSYGGGFSVGRNVASNLVAFDVDKDGNAKFVKIKGR